MNKIKKVYAFVCIVLCGFLCLTTMPLHVYAANAETDSIITNTADETADTSSNAETVKVAVIDYPKYLTMSDSGAISGYAYEYLQDIAKHTGWKYEFERMTFADAMTALQDGKIDILPGNQYTDKRAETMDFSSRSMGEGGSVLCVRLDDTRYCYNDYSAYDGIKIAALAGSVRMEQAKTKLSEYGVTADFVEYNSDDAAKEALEQKKVDAVLMSSIRCEDKYKILARLDSTPLYFCTNQSKPELKTELDQAMEAIHLDNPYYEQQLDEKYYSSVSIQLAFTQAEKKYIEDSPVLNVAVSDDFAPIEYYDKKSNSFHGLVPDLMDLIAKNSGLTFRYVARDSLEDTLEKVTTGEVMMIASVADRTELADAWNVTLTNAYRSNSLSVVINNTSDAYQKLDSLVVLKAGYPYLEKAALDEGYSNFTYVDTFAECVKMVHTKKAVLSFIPSNSTDLLFDQTGYDDLSTYLLLNSNTDFSVGISKTADPLLISIINKSIAAISSEEKSVLLIENLNTVNDSMSLKKYFVAHRVGILAGILVLAILIILLAFSLAVQRKKANHRLESALKRADSASNAKTDFLSRMSHDIRTPMNAIIGLTDLAKDEPMSDAAQDYLTKIDSSSKFLLGLINDILDMSKIESGELTLNPEPFSRQEFTQSVSTIIKPLMDAKHITFVFEVSDAYECIMVDRLRHNQIFFNLLSNASKFTPEGGKVEFIVTSLPSKNGLVGQEYCVRDNGIGMSAEFLERMFEPFSQEQTIVNEVEKGTGLGLPIVKSLVDAMKGTITVTSEVGKGTEFHIVLYYPLAVNQKETKVQSFSYERLKGARVLLAEDHPLNAEIATKLLERVGCNVTWAKDGQECLEIFDASKNQYYDVILMDMRMPRMDGLTATREIRKLSREDATAVPIIAMTANAYTEDIEKCLSAGMNAHLAKPVEPGKLYETISENL